MKTYKVELIGASGDKIVTVVSKSPLSPRKIKQKLVNWINSGWEMVNYWECTNYLEGYLVNAINRQTRQSINYYSSFCERNYLLTGLQQELKCQKGLLTKSEFNPERWTISVRPQTKIIP